MLFYLIVITVVVKLRPDLAPLEPSVPFLEKLRALPKVSGVFAVVGVILLGIYMGWMTPTESAGVATAIILVMALAGRMGLRDFGNGLLDTIQTTAMIFMVLWGVMIFVRFLAFTGLPAHVTGQALALNVPRWVILAAVIVLYLLLGMILDSSSILLIAVPLMLPVVIPLGFDLVWFGIVTVIAVEIGLLTPPFGISVYVVKATLEDKSITLGDIFRGAMPFVGIMFLVLLLVVAWPPLTLALVPGR